MTVIQALGDLVPPDMFRVGDKIRVIATNTKHKFRTGTVTGWGRTRLNVKFDDPKPGSFIDWEKVVITE